MTIGDTLAVAIIFAIFARPPWRSRLLLLLILLPIGLGLGGQG